MSPLLTRILVYGLMAGFVVALAELDGYRRGEKKLWEYQAEQGKAAVVVVTKQGATTQRVVTKYVHVTEASKAAADEIKLEVQNYANTSACIDADWRRLHDAAALGALPGTAAPPDGEVRPTGADAGSHGDDGAQRTLDRH